MIGDLLQMNLKRVRHSIEFAEILRIIHSGRAKAFEVVNVALAQAPHQLVGDSQRFIRSSWPQIFCCRAEASVWLCST
jgi:hypothetical protein